MKLISFCSSDRRLLRQSVFAFGALVLAGCGGAEESTTATMDLAFEARFGAQAFDCNATFQGLGSTHATAKPLDFRFFVHDVELVRSAGEHVPFDLANDGIWQRDGVALLDFEDGTGSCDTGSPETNRSLHGTAPKHDDYTGIAFTLGIPEAMNHLDAATAPAPFNAPGLWWSWQGGYKYVRIDIASDNNPGGFYFHLGGTNCDGLPDSGFTCQYGNLARIELESSRMAPIVVDAAALYGGVDLNHKPDFQTDFVAG